MKPLANRIKKIVPSATLTISAKAKALRQKGVDVIDFGVGEPDFDTPNFIKEAAISAIKEGFTKYTPSSGILQLKEAVVKKFELQNNLKYSTEQIIISCGAKHSLYNCIMALCNPKDEVIIFSPYWVSYPEMIKLAGAIPVIVETEEKNDFLPKPKDIEKKITKKTKAIIINSPSNPTGCVFDEQLLEKIAKIAIKYDLWIISDEVYERIIFDSQKHISIAQLSEKIKERTLVVNAVSKTFAMTGWRIGYTAGPKEVIKAMDEIQSHTTSNPTSISQKAAVAALTTDSDEVVNMLKKFEERRNLLVEKLSTIKDVSFFKPKGAFYLFLNISKFFNKKISGKIFKNSLDIAEYLLDEAAVALVPGVAFGNDNYIRISFATAEKNIEEGIERIKNALNKK